MHLGAFRLPLLYVSMFVRFFMMRCVVVFMHIMISGMLMITCFCGASMSVLMAVFRFPLSMLVFVLSFHG